VQLQPAAAVAAYALLLLAAAQANLQALSRPKWRPDPEPTRLSTASLINLLRHELWNDSITKGLTSSPSPAMTTTPENSNQTFVPLYFMLSLSVP